MQQHQKRLAGLEAAALRGAAAGGHLLLRRIRACLLHWAIKKGRSGERPWDEGRLGRRSG